MIEKAILDADRKGIKVLSLGLRNQGEELNIYGGLYVSRHPKLKVKIVDGSSLVIALLLNTIPKGTTQVLLRGKLTKVAYGLAFTLSQQNVQVSFSLNASKILLFLLKYFNFFFYFFVLLNLKSTTFYYTFKSVFIIFF